jgi:hypothetical protein
MPPAPFAQGDAVPTPLGLRSAPVHTDATLRRGVQPRRLLPDLHAMSARGPGIAAATVGVVALGLLASTASAGSNTFVQTPSRNVVCQLNQSTALCTVLSSGREARVDRRGHVRVFAQNSNPPIEGVRTLAYGRSVAIAGFRCVSRTSGMRCVERKSRHGFLAAREKITTF